MKHGLILLCVGVLLLVITAPVTAQPAETADGSFTAVVDFSTLRAKPRALLNRYRHNIEQGRAYLESAYKPGTGDWVNKVRTSFNGAA